MVTPLDPGKRLVANAITRRDGGGRMKAIVRATQPDA
jgi:hypothetical protein